MADSGKNKHREGFTANPGDCESANFAAPGPRPATILTDKPDSGLL
jgi:hypothetical protein